MIEHMNAEKVRYETNFVRSAIAPEQIVTAVPANTTWKKKKVEVVRLATPLPPKLNLSSPERKNPSEPRILLSPPNANA